MSFAHSSLENCRRVFIKDYRVEMEIGIYPHEQNKKQLVIVNVEFWTELKKTNPIADDIKEVINHDFVRFGIQDIIKRGRINLQETLCNLILELCFSQPLVIAARVRTEKKEVYPDCESAGVEVFKLRV